MKHFNTVFDILLYESIFVFFFGLLLSVLKDPVSGTLLTVAAISFVLASILGATGYYFKLFTKETLTDDF